LLAVREMGDIHVKNSNPVYALTSYAVASSDQLSVISLKEFDIKISGRYGTLVKY
jgi:hypothetical protein